MPTDPIRTELQHQIRAELEASAYGLASAVEVTNAKEGISRIRATHLDLLAQQMARGLMPTVRAIVAAKGGNP